MVNESIIDIELITQLEIGSVVNVFLTTQLKFIIMILFSFDPLQQQTVETLLESGYSLVKEQELIMNTKLSRDYMKNMDD